MIAAQRGYRTKVVVSYKSSAEKIATLRAYGAEVIVTVGGVTRDDPRHVSQIAARVAAQTPGGVSLWVLSSGQGKLFCWFVLVGGLGAEHGV
ncbi:hypothetical protein GCM10010434_095700 [Winogradskya humida]